MKRKSIKFKILTIILFTLLCLIIGGKDVNAATNHDQTEAISWATNKGDIKWNEDVDGAYGCQCVDLILAYYDYLVGYHMWGNACDYTWNDLPAGWTRVYDSPREGDIVVWNPGAAMGWSPLITCYADSTYGHIGIVWKVNDWGTIGTIETNGGNGSAAGYYERYPNNVACYIRPDFKNIKDDLAPIENFGDNFYAYLIMSNNLDLFNVDVDGTVVLQKGVWQDPKQIWNFNRQSDGSYIIKNAYTGKYLDVQNSNDWDGGVIQTSGDNSSSAQRFFLSGTQDKCILRPACSSIRVVSVDGGVNLAGKKLNMWEYWGVDTQFFNVWKVDEAKASSLNYTVNGNNVNLNWTKGENADKYNIIISRKSNIGGSMSEYKRIEDISQTSYEINLPNGYYEVTVEGWNYFSNDFSNVVKFKIGNEVTVPVLEYTISEDKVTFNWTKGENADKYTIGIYTKSSEEDGERILYKSIKEILQKSYEINLPAGNYEAAVIAENSFGFEYSNFVKFTIEEKNNTGNKENEDIIDNSLPFNDVKSTSWYYNSVKYVYTNKIMTGYNSTTFAPNDKATRGMVVSVLYKMEGYPKVSGDSKFTDVKSTAYYAKAIKWATDKGIVNGYTGTNKFGPDDNIKRQDFAIILRNYAKYKNKNINITADLTKYKDSKMITNYANASMQWAVGTGVITGNLDGTLNPKGTATRAEAAAIIQKYCNKVGK